MEAECAKVGLGLNGPKTKYLTYNIDEHPPHVRHTPLVTRNGTTLEEKEDFKYLGSWVDESLKDIRVRKGLAWKALNDMDKVWKSNLKPDLKKRFFVATVESILIYGCESWAVNDKMEKMLNGTYTRMLRRVLNVHWSSHTTNEQLSGKLPLLSDKIAARRLQLAGHCFRHPEFSTQKVVLWEPTHGQRSRGRPRTTFVDTLKKDTGAISTTELAALMSDRDVWRQHVRSRRLAT